MKRKKAAVLILAAALLCSLSALWQTRRRTE